jgi:hypothetical protein
MLHYRPPGQYTCPYYSAFKLLIALKLSVVGRAEVSAAPFSKGTLWQPSTTLLAPAHALVLALL